MAISEAAPSLMAQSMTCPLPVSRALMTPAISPKARYSAPPPKSPTRFSGGTGLSVVPMACSAPVMAM